MGKKPKGEKLSYDGWVDRGIRFFFRSVCLSLNSLFSLQRRVWITHTHTPLQQMPHTHAYMWGDLHDNP